MQMMMMPFEHFWHGLYKTVKAFGKVTISAHVWCDPSVSWLLSRLALSQVVSEGCEKYHTQIRMIYYLQLPAFWNGYKSINHWIQEHSLVSHILYVQLDDPMKRHRPQVQGPRRNVTHTVTLIIDTFIFWWLYDPLFVSFAFIYLSMVLWAGEISCAFSPSDPNV